MEEFCNLWISKQESADRCVVKSPRLLPVCFSEGIPREHSFETESIKTITNGSLPVAMCLLAVFQLPHLLKKEKKKKKIKIVQVVLDVWTETHDLLGNWTKVRFLEDLPDCWLFLNKLFLVKHLSLISGRCAVAPWCGAQATVCQLSCHRFWGPQPLLAPDVRNNTTK